LRPRKEELVATPVSTPALRHVITPLHWFLLQNHFKGTILLTRKENHFRGSIPFISKRAFFKWRNVAAKSQWIRLFALER